jgi:hypothetical protein
MIPIENSVAGRVADIHHLMPYSKLHIIAEHFMPVRHQLLGVKGSKLEDIQTVESHVHALGQCRKIIHKLGIKPVVLAVIAQAIWKLAPSLATRWELALLVCIVFVAGLIGVNELLLLLGSGALGILLRRRGEAGDGDGEIKDAMKQRRGGKALLFLGGSGFLGGLFSAPGLAAIFLYFLYCGTWKCIMKFCSHKVTYSFFKFLGRITHKAL